MKDFKKKFIERCDFSETAKSSKGDERSSSEAIDKANRRARTSDRALPVKFRTSIEGEKIGVLSGRVTNAPIAYSAPNKTSMGNRKNNEVLFRSRLRDLRTYDKIYLGAFKIVMDVLTVSPALKNDADVNTTAVETLFRARLLDLRTRDKTYADVLKVVADFLSSGRALKNDAETNTRADETQFLAKLREFRYSDKTYVDVLEVIMNVLIAGTALKNDAEQDATAVETLFREKLRELRYCGKIYFDVLKVVIDAL